MVFFFGRWSNGFASVFGSVAGTVNVSPVVLVTCGGVLTAVFSVDKVVSNYVRDFNAFHYA